MKLVYEFGPFRLEGEELFAGNERIQIPAQALGVLLLLLEQPGNAFSSEEIFAAVWPGSWKPVARTVANTVYLLRGALNDPDGTLVRSSFRKGYALMTEVKKTEKH